MNVCQRRAAVDQRGLVELRGTFAMKPRSVHTVYGRISTDVDEDHAGQGVGQFGRC